MNNTPTDDGELREQLEDMIDNRRFDTDYKGGLHADNQYVVDILLPFIHQYGNTRAVEARDELILELSEFGERGGDSIYKQTIGAEVVKRKLARTQPQKEEQVNE